jgi:hypothetical protein
MQMKGAVEPCYVDPMKLRGKGRSSPEWQFCWPYETEGEGQKLSWVTILLTPRNRGRMAASLFEWPLCWPYEAEGKTQNLSWVTTMPTLWSWGENTEPLLSDNNDDPMKLRVKAMVSLIWVTITHPKKPRVKGIW